MSSAVLRQEAFPDSTDSIGCVSAPSSPADAGNMERLIQRCKARAKQERLDARLARLRGVLTSSLRDAEEALLSARVKSKAVSIEIDTAYMRKVNNDLQQISEALSPKRDQSSLCDVQDATQSLNLVQSVDEGQPFQYAHSRHFVASSPVSVAPESGADIAAWDRMDASCGLGSSARFPVPATWNSPSSSAELFQTQQRQRPTVEATSRKKLTWFDGGVTDGQISALTQRSSEQFSPDLNSISGPRPNHDRFPQGEHLGQNSVGRGSLEGGRSTRTRSSGVSEWWCNLDDAEPDDNDAAHARLFMERVHGANPQPDLFKTIFGEQEMTSLSPVAGQGAADPCLSQDTSNTNGPTEKKLRSSRIPSVAAGANAYVKSLLHRAVESGETTYNQPAEQKLSSIPFAANAYIESLLYPVAASGEQSGEQKSESVIPSPAAQSVSPGDSLRQILARTEFEPHPEPQSVRKPFVSWPISSGREQVPQAEADAGIQQRLMKLENLLGSMARAPAVTTAPLTSIGSEPANKLNVPIPSSGVGGELTERSWDAKLSSSRMYRPSVEANIDEAQLKRLSFVEAALSAAARRGSRKLKTEPPRAAADTWSPTSVGKRDTIEIGNMLSAPGAGVAEMAVSVETVSGYHLDLALASSSPALQGASASPPTDNAQRFVGRIDRSADTVQSHVSQS